MTHPFAQPPPFHPPPARPPQVDARELRPRRFWYAIAGGLGALGVLAGFGFLVVGVVSALQNLPELEQRFRPGEQVTVQLSAGERLTIYAPDTGSQDECQAVDAVPGVDVSSPSYSFEFTSGGSTWYALYEVRATEAGEYTLTCHGSGPVYALGEAPEMGRFFATIFGSLAAVFILPLVGLLAGGGIVLIVALRRNSDRKRIQAQRSPPWFPPPR